MNNTVRKSLINGYCKTKSTKIHSSFFHFNYFLINTELKEMLLKLTMKYNKNIIV